jgi:hypothetical protein
MDPNFITKRLTNDKSYQKPNKTYQQTLSKEEIAKKLVGYKKVSDVKDIVLGTHVRYFTKSAGEKELSFRLGGFLTKFGEGYQYVVLSNGKLSWSVQLKNSVFYAKQSNKESTRLAEPSNTNDNTEWEKEKEREKTAFLLKQIEKQQKENEKLRKKLLDIELATKKDKNKK